jgi:hypothetical protein
MSFAWHLGQTFAFFIVRVLLQASACIAQFSHQARGGQTMQSAAGELTSEARPA